MHVRIFMRLPLILLQAVCLVCRRCMCGQARCGMCSGDSCILSMTPCRDLTTPVIASDGRVYDAHALRDWLHFCHATSRSTAVVPDCTIDHVRFLPIHFPTLDLRQRIVKRFRGALTRPARRGVVVVLPRRVRARAGAYSAYIDDTGYIVSSTHLWRFRPPRARRS